MKIIQESKEIVGTLVTQGQRFELLELMPRKRTELPAWFNENVYQFLIVNGQGFAQPLIVSRSGFYILPFLETKSKFVQFIVEDVEVSEENTPVLI